MLRAGLIGFPSTGKTTLFQLLTSALEAPRSGGKADASVGVARVPDERLDRLTALFNPRKRVPATVEFADIAGSTGARTGAQALLDVAPFRNADALLHVVRMFRDPAVPHPAGSVDPVRDVRAMEDEVLLADLGVVERRLERLERDLKKGNNPELRREQELLVQCRAALEGGRALRSLDLPPDAAKRLRGFQFLSAKPLLLVLNLDEADLAAAGDAMRLAGLESFLSGAAGYDVAKGGLRNLTRTLCLELAPDHINVNNIAPGMVLTPMNQSAIDDPQVREQQVQSIPWKRAAEPWEIANLAVYLASEEADYVTGQTFTIDGGLEMNMGQGA